MSDTLSVTERNLPELLRAAERRVNAFVFHKAYPEFCRIPADRDHDLDLLLCEAADKLEQLRNLLQQWCDGCPNPPEYHWAHKLHEYSRSALR